MDDYPYIAMDTEFPGVVARPVGNFKSSGEFIYQTLRYVWEEQPRDPVVGGPKSFKVGAAASYLWGTYGKYACRCNVDMLKLIQLGLTFTDKEGNLPRCGGELAVWQFNFRYSTEINNDCMNIFRHSCYLRSLSATAVPHTCTLESAGAVSREFRLSTDIYAQDSIELLKHSGIDFSRNESQGIDVQRFAELLMSSGVVLNDEV